MKSLDATKWQNISDSRSLHSELNPLGPTRIFVAAQALLKKHMMILARRQTAAGQERGDTGLTMFIK